MALHHEEGQSEPSCQCPLAESFRSEEEEEMTTEPSRRPARHADASLTELTVDLGDPRRSTAGCSSSAVVGSTPTCDRGRRR